MSNDGKPKTDPPTEAHDSNRLGGEEPPYYAAAAALEDLDDDLIAHSDSTGGVHGVAEDDTVAGQGDVDAVTSDLNDHAGSTSGVHGVGGSNVESESGAQSKADSAESAAKDYTDDHENKNNPHSDSAAYADLYTDGEARSAVDGSNVTVQNAVVASEAGDASQLGGENPAYYADGATFAELKNSTTWNVPDEAAAVFVYIIGAGNDYGGNGDYGGAGGSATLALIDADRLGSSVDITVGAAPGGNTTFWNLTAAGGGGRGMDGLAEPASNRNIYTGGKRGDFDAENGGSSYYGAGGGNSYYGDPGRSVLAGDGGDKYGDPDGRFPGGGGAGNGDGGGSTGVGADGVCWLWWW